MNFYELLFWRYLNGGGSKPAWDGATFNVFKDGTEQLLPVNTSEPTTSPFLGDIRYPDGIKKDQEFFYRESPATYDGKAQIVKVKGNTVKFNQLVQNGNFINTDNWAENQGTVSVDNNVLTLTITSQAWSQNIAQPNKSVIANHKYLMAFDIQISVISHGVMGRLYSSSADTRMTMRTVSANTKTRIAEIITPTQSYTANMILYCCFQNSTESNGLPVGATVRYSNVMLIDLTAIFGSGNEPSTPEAFETWLSNNIGLLPYYDYTTGKLLPFLGEELKTTNADQTVESIVNLPTLDYFTDGMKSAGSVYDEITENKAITRVGSVDLGSLTWTKGGTAFNTLSLASLIKLPPNNSTKPNIIGVNMIPVSSNDDSGVVGTYEVIVNKSTGQLSYRYPMRGIADGDAFAALMSGTYMYFELAEPVETPININALQNQALSTILGRTVSVSNPQEPLDILLKGE